MICPHATPVGTGRRARVWCALLNAKLGWRHGLLPRVCEDCEKAGGWHQFRDRPAHERRVLQMRIQDGRRAERERGVKPTTPYAQAFAEYVALCKEQGWPDDAWLALAQGVRNHLPFEEAEALIEAAQFE